MNPRYSIITCTKNSAKYLTETITSVRSQTFSNYEHIFVDGFSTDGTKEMILKYQKQNPERVKLFQFEANGITDAMNLGIKYAAGEYLIHLHSDDYLDNPDVIMDVDEFLRTNDNPDWIYGKAKYVNYKSQFIRLSNSTRFSRFNSNDFLRRQMLKYRDTVCHQSVFIKKEVFNRLGVFDEKDTDTADYDYWLRIMNKTRWLFFNQITCNFRFHEDGQSSSEINAERMHFSTILAQKRNLKLIEFYFILPAFTVISYNHQLIKSMLKSFRYSINRTYVSTNHRT